VKFPSVDIFITFIAKGTEQYGLALDSALLWAGDGIRGSPCLNYSEIL